MAGRVDALIWVANGQQAGHRTVHADKGHGVSLSAQRVCLFEQLLRNGSTVGFHIGLVSDHYLAIADGPPDPGPGYRFEGLSGRERQAPLFCGLHDGIRQRMAAILRDRGCEAQQVVFGDPSRCCTRTNSGFPTVKVPVLSTMTTWTVCITSRTSALRISTPLLAPRPMPTMTDIGVASPSAHGQAMIRTATALVTAAGRRGSGPSQIQNRNVTIETVTMAGTKTADTRSASF